MVSAAIKGYVVRGLYKGRHMGISDLHGSTAGLREPHPFAALDYAAERAIELRRFDWSDVAIFRVLDDGREERLPSYEEALAMLGGDPLAALEAAERRLLEAGGWVEVEVGADIWKRETEERTGSYALAIERRRLAAKGGA